MRMLLGGNSTATKQDILAQIHFALYPDEQFEKSQPDQASLYFIAYKVNFATDSTTTLA